MTTFLLAISAVNGMPMKPTMLPTMISYKGDAYLIISTNETYLGTTSDTPNSQTTLPSQDFGAIDRARRPVL